MKATGERLAALEAGQASEALKTENAELRLRIAFNDECHMHNVKDRDAIWKLAGDDLAAVADESGQVDAARLATVVGSLVERYPHFSIDDAPDDVLPSGPPSGRRTDGKMRTPSGAVVSEVLIKKFPALGR